MHITMVSKGTVRKWWLYGVLVVLYLASLGIPAAHAEDIAVRILVPNAGFEAVQEDVSVIPTSWSYWSSGLSEGVSLNDSSDYTGHYSMRIVKTKA